MKTNILIALISLVAIIGGACGSQNHANHSSGPNQNSHQGMNHNSSNTGANNQGMDHPADHSTMQSSPHAASAPYDLQFIDTMIAHHQGAVEMAKPAVGKAGHTELKTLAQNIIADQEKEIANMKKWRDEWFSGKPAAVNIEMAGMHDSMKGMDMMRLESLNGRDFDLEFIKQMTPHHEGAVQMAREALQKSERGEIKTLAEAIIKSQEAEIKQMKNWQADWSK